MADITRRNLIGTAAAGLGAALLPGVANAEPPRKRMFRIAHLTDIHLQPELNAAIGFERALDHAQAHAPDLILTGGDLIMDALDTDLDRMKTQWDLYKRVVRANISVPLEQSIGNHDIWGWNNRAKYRTTPGFGKTYALDTLGLDRGYRSFDRGGWHFVILDSSFPGDRTGYKAYLDHDQFEWLADDLRKTPKNRPVLVMSHIPILAVCAYFDGRNEETGHWHVPAAWMHIDARRIKDLFKSHPNVKVCISGHAHMVDQCRYLDVDYLCNGAVSGGWWKGPFQEFAPGYAVMDLYADGTYSHKYVPFGWNAHA